MDFISENEYEIKNKGWAYPIKLDRTCYHFDWLLAKEVRINGQKRTVLGVERFLHAAPWINGETISLLVKERVLNNGKPSIQGADRP